MSVSTVIYGTDSSGNPVSVPFTANGDFLLDNSEAKLEVWECLLALGIIYVGFMVLALIGLKFSSRRV